MYCEKCGARLVEQELDGRTRRMCPACGAAAYHCLRVDAGVLIDRGGALLLLRRGPNTGAFPGTWCLPAGCCQPDEAPAATVVREARQETGLDVRISCLEGAYYFRDDSQDSGVLLVYETDVGDGDPRPDGIQRVDVGFFKPEELPDPLCGDGHDLAILAWAARALDRWEPGEPLRFCPHCRCEMEESESYGRVRPVCPTCGYVHFQAPKVGVSVLVEQGGRVLLIQRAIEPGLGQWSLPSGFIEFDESPEVAAAREVVEETGIEVQGLELLGVEHYAEDYRGPGLNISYHAQAAGGALHAADDAAGVRFFSPGELPRLDRIAFKSHRRLLADWLGRQAG